MKPLILIRGGGDLASGVALRLHRVGFQVAILELPAPLSVRRTVSFSEAVYEGHITVEDVTARLVSADQLQDALDVGEIPVLVDPEANILHNQLVTSPQFTYLVDARLLKKQIEPLDIKLPVHIGLGPGFTAGGNCHAVIETRRSHTLGRVIWEGEAQADSGQPEGDPRRVLRAPGNGNILSIKSIGDHVEEGEPIATLNDVSITSPMSGVLRGLIHPKAEVSKGIKIGDVDPRDEPEACFLVSDKALAIGGGVLEAILVISKDLNKEN